MVGKIYVIKVSSNNLVQILNGLKSRAVAYRNAEKFHDEGYCDAFDNEVAQCDDADEARDIAVHYEDIISDLESQMGRQDFMEKAMAENLDKGKETNGN